MRAPESNYRYFVEAMHNRKPERLPIYEHYINNSFISRYVNRPMDELFNGTTEDIKEYFRLYVDFWQNRGYDTVSFELGIPDAFPGSGALMSHKDPAITTAEEFLQYPFDGVVETYFRQKDKYFTLFAEEVLKRDGIRAVGGPGCGIFETSEDLTGYMNLCFLMADEPEITERLYENIRNIYEQVWSRFLRDYSEPYCVCRMGDDLGFDTQTLIRPDDIRRFVIPGYRKIIELSHSYGKPFLLHSCGNIFCVMDDIIDAGIDGKHSNEDNIAPFSEWTKRYGDRICNVGGLDMNDLCLLSAEEIKKKTRAVIEENIGCGGFAFGTGNSIPDYIPAEGYNAMLEAANEYRLEQTKQ